MRRHSRCPHCSGPCEGAAPGRHHGQVDEQPFVLGPGRPRRWIMYPPVDPYGDGYVAHLRVEVVDDGLHAATTAMIDDDRTGGPGDLVGFLRRLADDWRGWSGTRVWNALEHEMTLDARHEGRGYVLLGVTLRRSERPYADNAWSARVVFVLEAGEEMTALARNIDALLSQRTPGPADNAG